MLKFVFLLGGLLALYGLCAIIFNWNTLENFIPAKMTEINLPNRGQDVKLYLLDSSPLHLHPYTKLLDFGIFVLGVVILAVTIYFRAMKSA